MTYILLQDCEIAEIGKKKACLKFSKKHPTINFTLLVINGELKVKGGKVLK